MGKARKIAEKYLLNLKYEDYLKYKDVWIDKLENEIENYKNVGEFDENLEDEIEELDFDAINNLLVNELESEGVISLSFNELKEKILKHKAKSEYKQASIVILRNIFDGTIIVGGSISSGESILAIQALGADLAYMGTRFIATEESDATEDYKQMILNASASDIIKSNKITGVNGNWLEESLQNAGISPNAGGIKSTIADFKKMLMPLIKQKLKVDFDVSKATAKRWKDIFSAGQGVGSISNVPSVEDLVIELEQQYTKSKSRII